MDIRENELKNVQRQLLIIATNCAILFWIPIFGSACSVAFWAWRGNQLEASFVFSVIGLFNALSSPIWRIPDVFLNLVTGMTACKRVTEYLNAPERLSQVSDSSVTDPDLAVVIRDASWEWELKPPSKMTKRAKRRLKRAMKAAASLVASPQATIKSFAEESATDTEDAFEGFARVERMSLKVPRGSLTIVVGPVGSGKTSLLASLVGDLRRLEGSLKINGTVGYAQQQAWIRNASVRDNILFGRPFDPHLYAKVVEQCTLTADFDALPHGDATLIGEKGVALSGGQKQRVGLARLVYQQPQIAIMDDVMSALDPHVAATVFEGLIMTGLLAGSTRILATHNISLLHQADQIVVMGAGRVVASGTYEEVFEQRGRLSPLIQEILNNPEESDDEEEGEEQEMIARTVSPAPLALPEKTPVKIKDVEEEPDDNQEVIVGSFGANLASYIRLRGGWLYTLPVILALVGIEGTRVGRDLFLKNWLSQSPVSTATASRNALIFCGLGLAQGLATCLFGLGTVFFGLAVSRAIHRGLLGKIMRAFVSFFDTTPIGAILVKFGHELGTVDSNVPDFNFHVWYVTALTISTLVLVSWTAWPVLVIIVPLVLIAAALQSYYRAAWRIIQILIGQATIPLTSHFAETFYGLSTIRSFQAEPMFRQEMHGKLDNYARGKHMSQVVRRWISVRGELIGDCCVLVVCAVCIGLAFDKETAGLLINYTLGAAGLCDWLLKQLAELESSLLSVERIALYDKLEEEDDQVNTAAECLVPPGWPARGLVEFDRVTSRYRSELPPVLRNLSFTIQPGQRVAIVGRSGAGKSSIVAAIYRMAKISGEAGDGLKGSLGSLRIDGVDICSLSAEALRENLAIVPQDPVLFAGTLRFNLDPKGQRTDDQIWRGLERANLRSFVSKLPGKLDAQVDAGGSNFSVGQRQLLCLARTILKEAKILVLDEATANVDVDSDALIQKALRGRDTLGPDCTVITIAHRIRTVLHYDRILVLRRGERLEYDSPKRLLRNPNSEFSRMVTSRDLVDCKIDLNTDDD